MRIADAAMQVGEEVRAALREAGVSLAASLRLVISSRASHQSSRLGYGSGCSIISSVHTTPVSYANASASALVAVPSGRKV